MLYLLLAAAAVLQPPPRGTPPHMGQSGVAPRGMPPRRVIQVDLDGGKSVGVVAAWPVWPASQALARAMAHAPSICRGKRVLELGCGLGAIGLAAAASGAAEVLLTDAEPTVLECVEEAAVATGVAENVKTQVFDWSDHEQRADLQARARPFDLLLAADVLYDEASPDLVASLIAALLPSAESEALIADPQQRTYRTAFDIACTERGLRMEEGPLPGPEGMRLLSVSKTRAMA